MATESAADSELSVTLSPPLSKWLEERATALGIDRRALLLQLLETHRQAAELDSEDFEAMLSEAATAEDSVVADQDDLDELEGHIGDIDAELSEHVEDLRSRILQLKDAVESRAPAEHDHSEMKALSKRIKALSTDLESVETDSDELAAELGSLSSDLDSTDDRLETTETRLHRLAQIVLELKQRTDRTAGVSEALENLRRTANRNGTTAADCDSCGERLRIGLLTEAACPQCGQQFDDIEQPSSILGRFRAPRLTGPNPDPTESDETPGPEDE